MSSIGDGLESMTSQNGGQYGRHGSKMADFNPRGRPSPDKGHDLLRPVDAFGVTSEGELTP